MTEPRKNVPDHVIRFDPYTEPYLLAPNCLLRPHKQLSPCDRAMEQSEAESVAKKQKVSETIKEDTQAAVSSTALGEDSSMKRGLV